MDVGMVPKNKFECMSSNVTVVRLPSHAEGIVLLMALEYSSSEESLGTWAVMEGGRALKVLPDRLISTTAGRWKTWPGIVPDSRLFASDRLVTRLSEAIVAGKVPVMPFPLRSSSTRLVR